MPVTSDQIADWLRGQARAAGAGGFVVGLSGGVDSAVVARLCQLATPGEVLGVILPCHSDPQDESDARALARLFELPVTRIDLDDPFTLLVERLTTAAGAALGDDARDRVPVANVKPRLRMTALYFLANALGYLVAGTSNRCEIEVGYFTKHGDGAADVLPIGGLLKRDVVALALALDVPEAIVDRVPSAGLWIGQRDEDELGFTYRHLEAYLDEGPEAVPPALAMKIDRLMRSSTHKRALPPDPGY